MRRQLAQARPAGTSAVSLFSQSSSPYEIDLINITNVAGSDTTVSIFHDANGTTYDESTALIWQVPLVSGETIHFEAKIADYQKAGGVGIQTSVGSAATFTAYGEIAGERL